MGWNYKDLLTLQIEVLLSAGRNYTGILCSQIEVGVKYQSELLEHSLLKD